MPQHRGLGKGLEALIPTGSALPEPAISTGGVAEIPLASIQPNPRQPRSSIDPASLEELAASIREHGVIQPLIVSRAESGEGYVLVAGERRLQAAHQAGLATIPAIVRQTTDEQRLELALIENIQRADLNALEEAHAFQQMADEFGLSHEQIATRVGKSRVSITNTLRLLKLAPAAQQALVDGKITEGHARALLGLEASEAQEAALKVVIAKELNVRQTEELVRRLSGVRSPALPRPAVSPDLLALEERLRTSLGTKVKLRGGSGGKGSLLIHYYSTEELDALLKRLLDKE
jgi:ParB family transcriptional regulator, chromosome partitioning protein